MWHWKKISPWNCQCWEKLMDKKLIARRNWWLLVFEKETPQGKKHECLETMELGISVVKTIFWVKKRCNWFLLVFLQPISCLALLGSSSYPTFLNCKVLLILLFTSIGNFSFLHFWPSHFSTNELESNCHFPPILWKNKY